MIKSRSKAYIGSCSLKAVGFRVEALGLQISGLYGSGFRCWDPVEGLSLGLGSWSAIQGFLERAL